MELSKSQEAAVRLALANAQLQNQLRQASELSWDVCVLKLIAEDLLPERLRSRALALNPHRKEHSNE